MFSICYAPIDVDRLANGLAISSTGALVTFTGLVRDCNNGKSVLEIEYELFDRMVLKEAESIILNGLERFSIQAVKAVHRGGVIKVGEAAIFLGVTAMHRKDAFKAAEYLMNQFKHQLPIWKKETYSDQSCEWVFCHCGG